MAKNEEETRIEVNQMSDAELAKAMEDIAKANAIKKEAELRRKEKEAAEKAAIKEAKRLAEEARKVADRQQRQKEWEPSQVVHTPEKCPRCGEDLKKKPPKNMKWQCSHCGEHRH